MWNILVRRKVIIIGWFLGLILIFILTPQEDYITYQTELKNVKAIKVWEYVMDFNNLKNLNPTILDFTVIQDENKDGKWTYRVKYTERLYQLPFVHNYADATYRIQSDSEKYYIFSIHYTCFLGNFICFRSSSVFSFNDTNAHDTHCQERVIYECPRIFSHFCLKEVLFQRKSIFKNLEKIFAITSSPM